MVDTFCLYEFMVLPFSWWPVATVYGVVVSLIYIFLLYCGVVVLCSLLFWWKISYLTEIKIEAVILFYQLSDLKITQWPITAKRRLLTPNVNPVVNGNS